MSNNLFLVSYDLRKPGQAYDRVIQALESMGAKRTLLSQWALRSHVSAVQLREALQQYIDQNDRLVVAQVSEWSSWNALVDINQVGTVAAR